MHILDELGVAMLSHETTKDDSFDRRRCFIWRLLVFVRRESCLLVLIARVSDHANQWL
jgi:hypothetical protein